ncbi:MAG TPA: hypothetical protein VFR15_07210 [Chloroflexia bacterium]|nr:hypothetical protein [Chloroflexia bacterium]
MIRRFSLTLILMITVAGLAACGGGPPAPATPTPEMPSSEPSPIPSPTGTVVDTAQATAPVAPEEEAATPTAVTATGTGEAITALQALERLKPLALDWQQDARLVMLANVRPGQEGRLLGVALGDPDVNEATPEGKGRNWALIAFSPSAQSAVALAMDGTQTDLAQEGALTDALVEGLSAPEMSALDLAQLDTGGLTDSDEIARRASEAGMGGETGIALLAPDGLGIGPLPPAEAGNEPPRIAYELFSADPSTQAFAFFDALTGQVVLDSNTP